MNCEKCGGECYDNRAENAKRLAEGKKARPEYACKDKDGCGWVKWPPKEAKKPTPNGKPPAAGPVGAPRYTPLSLHQQYQLAARIAKAVVNQRERHGGGSVSHQSPRHWVEELDDVVRALVTPAIARNSPRLANLRARLADADARLAAFEAVEQARPYSTTLCPRCVRLDGQRDRRAGWAGVLA